MPQPSGGNNGGGNNGGGNTGGGLIVIDGDNNPNILAGTGEDERIRGKRGDDTIFAAGGDDIVEGDQGNDILVAGGGADTLDGGAGFDVVWYRAAGSTGVNDITFGDYFSVFGYEFAIGAGETTITDIDPTDGDTGSDTLIDVEQAVFWDDDADGDGTAGTITVHLDGTNNVALAVNDTFTGIGEDTIMAIDSAALLANDLEFDGEAVSVASVDTTLTLASTSITINPDGTVAAIGYDPTSTFDHLAEGETATDGFRYTVADPNGAGTSTLVTLIVEGRNDAPELSGTTAAVLEDGPILAVDIAALATDIDSDDDRATLGYAVVAPPAAGTAAIDGTTLRFAASAGLQDLSEGETRDVVIQVQATDRHGAVSNTADVVVTVTGTNDGVGILPGQNTFDVFEAADGSADEIANRITAFAATRGFTDLDLSDTHTLTAGPLTPTTGGQFDAAIIVDSTGTGAGTYGWTYSIDDMSLDGLAEDEVVFESFSVIVSDGNGGTTNNPQQFRLVGANDAPDAVDDVAAAVENGPAILIDVLANDNDVDSDDDATTIRVSSATAASGASVRFSGAPGDGVLTYDPASVHAFGALVVGEVVTDTITYEIRDSHNAATTAHVIVSVTGTNDAPVLRAGSIGDELLLANHFGDNSVWLNEGAGAFIDSGQRFGDFDSRNTTAIATADLDGDGDLDVVTASLSSQPGRVYLNDGQGRLTDTGQALANADARDVVLGDFDGDGDVDAMFASTPFGPIRVFLNDGSGAMTDNGAPFDFGDTRSISLGDVDGDGDLDAIVAGQESRIYLNDGAGIYIDSGQLIGAGVFSPDVDLADLDGDGDLDLFLSNANGIGDLVFFNDGSGVFSDSGQSLGTQQSEETALVDIDGDGDLDAIVAGQSGEPGRIYRNDGTGLFTDTGQALGSRDSRGLATVDVDGDGDVDALFANTSGSELYLNDGSGLFSLAQTFNGSIFAAAFADLDGFNQPEAQEDGAAVAIDLTAYADDADGDDDATTLSYAIIGEATEASASISGAVLTFDPGAGFQDLAEGETRDVVIQVQATDGHGAVSNIADVVVTVTGTNDAPIAINDLIPTDEETVLTGNLFLDNLAGADSDPDGDSFAIHTVDGAAPVLGVPVTLASGATLILEANGDFIFDPRGAFDFVSEGSGSADGIWYTVVDSNGAVSNEVRANFSVLGLNDAPELAAGNGAAVEDGLAVEIDLSVLGTDPDSTENGTTLGYAILAQPAEGFAAISGTALTFDPGVGFQDLAEGEIRDVVIQIQATDAHGAQSNPADVTVTVTGTNDAPVVTSVARLQGDPDIVWGRISNLGDPVSLNDGSGDFTDGVSLTPQARHIDVGLDDLDGGGDLDILGARSSSQVDVLLNDGSGSFASNGQINLAVGSNTGLDLGDIDGDGDLDAYLVRQSGQASIILVNDGAGIFTSSVQNVGIGLNASDVALGDLDGDGDLDAFVTNVAAGDTVLLNDGSGTFTDSGQSHGTAISLAVKLGDVDGDGDVDAVVANADFTTGRANQVYFNDGTGVFTDSGQTLGMGNSQDVALGDIDGDGDLDAVFASRGDPGTANRVYFNDGSGTYSDSGQSIGDDHSLSVALADLDGDGDLDLAVGNTDPNALNAIGTAFNRIYTNDGAGNFTDTGQAIATVVTTSIAIGDIDGDGPPFAGGSVTELADGASGENTAVLTAGGTIPFTDADLTDTHAAGFVPQDGGAGYRGSFILGAPTTDGLGSGTLAWSFIVNDADLDDLAEGQTPTQRYDVTIGDGHGGTAIQTVTLTLTGTNDAPVVAEISEGQWGEDGPPLVFDLLRNSSDPDLNDTLSIADVTLSVSNPARVVPFAFQSDGRLEIDRSGFDDLTFVQQETLTFSFDVIDGNGGVTSNTMTVFIRGFNDTPIAFDDSAAATEDGAAVAIDVLVNDIDPDSDDDNSTLRVVSAIAASGATVTFSGLPGAGLEYDPASTGAFDLLDAGEAATDTITYAIEDSHGATASAAVTVTVTGVTDSPPTITLPAPGTIPSTIDEDSAALISGITVDLVGQANGTVAASLATNEGALTLTQIAGLTFSDADGSDGTLAFTGSETDVNAALANSIQFMPTEHYGGPAAVTLTISDAAGGAGALLASETIGLDVTPVADAPAILLALPTEPAPAAGWEAGPLKVAANVDVGLSENHLAVLTGGNIVVSSYDIVFTSPTTSTEEHFVTVLSPDGTQLATTPFVLDTFNGTSIPALQLNAQANPTSVVALPDGGFAAIWGVQISSPVEVSPDTRQVRIQYFAENGTPATGEIIAIGDGGRLDTNNQRGLSFTDAAVLEDGSLVLALRESQIVPGPFSNAFDTKIAIVSPGGSSVDTVILEEGAPSTGQLRVTATDNGGYLATWNEIETFPTTIAYAQWFDETGTALTERMSLGANLNGNYDVIQLADGEIVIARPNGTQGMTLEIIGFDGTTHLPVTIIAPGDPDFVSNPSLTALSDGTFAMAWKAFDSGDQVIYLQRFDASGTQIGALFEVDRRTIGTDKQIEAEIDVAPDGTVTVFWQEIVESEFAVDRDYYVRSFELSTLIREDTSFALPVDVALVDDDGSESISSVVLNGLPAGFSVSDGLSTLVSNGIDPLDITALDLTSPLTVTPAGDFFGTFTISVASTSVEAANGAEATSEQFLTITVNPVNDAPTLAEGATMTADEDGTTVGLDLVSLGGDVDPDDDGTTLSYTIVGAPDEGSAFINATGLIFDPGSDFQDLDAGETRDVTVRVRATDSHGAFAEADVTVTVNGAFDSPFTNITEGGNSTSVAPAISADGSTVAFESLASNLVDGEADVNGRRDILVYDIATETMTNITHGGDDDSMAVDISSDGSIVVFESFATNLVAGEIDTNGVRDIFMHDRVTGTTVNLTHGGDGESRIGSISDDGTRIMFHSQATNLVPGQADLNGAVSDIFVFDALSRDIFNITNGGTGDSAFAAISADGGTVAFHSTATNLDATQTDINGARLDVFFYDFSTGGARNITNGGNNGSSIPTVSGDGSTIAFQSFASNLIAGTTDVNGFTPDAFLFDVATSTTTNLTDGGLGTTRLPTISADATMTVFDSFSDNLVDGQVDENGGLPDVFVFDALSGAITNVTDGGNNGSFNPDISADNALIAFNSAATNLIDSQPDTNGTISDIFLFDWA